jgi:hypothetical protein
VCESGLDFSKTFMGRARVDNDYRDFPTCALCAVGGRRLSGQGFSSTAFLNGSPFSVNRNGHVTSTSVFKFLTGVANEASWRLSALTVPILPAGRIVDFLDPVWICLPEKFSHGIQAMQRLFLTAGFTRNPSSLRGSSTKCGEVPGKNALCAASAALLTACAFALGCTSPGEPDKSLKDQEIADLRTQSDRRQEAISKAQETIVGLREQIEQLGRERSKLSYELARVEGNCRSQSELATRFEAQSTAAADKLARSEEARLRLERTQLQVVQILETVQHSIGSLASTPSSSPEKPPAAGAGPGNAPSGGRSFSETVAWLGVQVQIARNLLQYPAGSHPDLAGGLRTLEPEPQANVPSQGVPSPSQGPALDGRPTAPSPPQPSAVTTPRTAEEPKPATVGFWSSFASLVGGHAKSLFQRGKALTAADVTFLGAILVFAVACMWILGTPLRLFLQSHKDKELGLLRRVVRTLERKEREPSPAVDVPPVAPEAPEEEEAIAAPEELAPLAVHPSPGEERLLDTGKPSSAATDVLPSAVLPSTPPVDHKAAGHHDTQHIGDTAQEDFTQTQVLPGAIQEDFTQTQEMPKVSEDELKNTQLIAGPVPTRASRPAPPRDRQKNQQPPNVVSDELSQTQQMPSGEQDFCATQALPEVPLDGFASTQMIQNPSGTHIEQVAGSAPASGRPAGLQPGRSSEKSGSKQGEKPLKTAAPRARQPRGSPVQKGTSQIGELSSNKELLDELEQLMGKKPSRPR